MATFKGLPLYTLEFDENFIPSMALALVDFPAIEVNWQAFGKESKRVLMKAVDEEKHIILGAAMIPDIPIYRFDGMNEYYITFSADTIAQVASGFARERHFNIMHDAALPAKCTLLESYILSAREGKTAPAGFDLPDGTWMVKAHIDDEDLWAAIKEGYYNGYSIESFFNSNYEAIMRKNNKLRRAALKVLCASVTAIDAEGKEIVLTFVEDELVDGIAVYIVDENGVMTPAADGEYNIGGVTYVVTDGIIARKPEAAPEAPAEEIIVEGEDEIIVDAPEAPAEMPEPDRRDDHIREMEERINKMEADYNTLIARIAEIEGFIEGMKTVEVAPVEEVTLREAAATKENPALKFFRK